MSSLSPHNVIPSPLCHPEPSLCHPERSRGTRDGRTGTTHDSLSPRLAPQPSCRTPIRYPPPNSREYPAGRYRETSVSCLLVVPDPIRYPPSSSSYRTPIRYPRGMGRGGYARPHEQHQPAGVPRSGWNCLNLRQTCDTTCDRPHSARWCRNPQMPIGHHPTLPLATTTPHPPRRYFDHASQCVISTEAEKSPPARPRTPTAGRGCRLTWRFNWLKVCRYGPTRL